LLPWIASRSLSSGGHSPDPLARNDGKIRLKLIPSCSGIATRDKRCFRHE
jgi:hypothetical protein